MAFVGSLCNRSGRGEGRGCANAMATAAALQVSLSFHDISTLACPATRPTVVRLWRHIFRSLTDSTTHTPVPCSLLLLFLGRRGVAICRPLKVLPTHSLPAGARHQRSWGAVTASHPPMCSSPYYAPTHQQTTALKSWTWTDGSFPLLFAGAAQARMRTESGTDASTTPETRHKTRRPRRCCSGRRSWGVG